MGLQVKKGTFGLYFEMELYLKFSFDKQFANNSASLLGGIGFISNRLDPANKCLMLSSKHN